jgi:hypothetical protein
MTRDDTSHSIRAFSKALTAALAGIAMLTVCASTASAGCADLPTTPARGPRLIQAGYRPPQFLRVSDKDAAIVGLWQVSFTSKGNDVPPFNIPDGAPLDAGYAQWHSDGTEIMNSSRDPATSSFCLGVWQAQGSRKYKLNHFALTWDNTGRFCTPPSGAPSCFVGPANIREEVTVDSRGKTYSGTVTIIQYDPNNDEMFRLTGTIRAKRITAD